MVMILNSLPKPLRHRLIGRQLAEYAWCLLLKPRRLSLPRLNLDTLIPRYADASITLGRLPRGSWASPVVDVVVLSKLANAIGARRVLELGSFRGYTTLALAQNIPEDGRVVAVDLAPDHGEAYRGRPEAMRIERRVGAIDESLFGPDDWQSFDLVFVDADHRYAAVEHDTALALRLVGPEGYVVWHDYANWGYYSGACGVPEYLGELSRERPVAQIVGSNMAIHRPCWLDRRRQEFDCAIAATAEGRRGDVWNVSMPRP